MKIVDVHSHILPGIDDGSQNIETTLEILNTCAQHGVDMMVATPHFYADQDRIDTFLEKRNEAYQKVLSAGGNEIVSIKLGAEVAYFAGISRAERINELAFENTNLLLLEMPFVTWDDSVLKEVKDLIEKRGLRIIIAHLERFLKIPGNKPYINRLLEMPVYVQINSQSLTDRWHRKDLLKLYKENRAQFIGSDCHGMHRRPPNLWEGRKVLTDKFGEKYMEQFDKNIQRIMEIE